MQRSAVKNPKFSYEHLLSGYLSYVIQTIQQLSLFFLTNCQEQVVHLKVWDLEEVSNVHQGCVYLIKTK